MLQETCSVVTFYRFVQLPDFRQLKPIITEAAGALGIKGTVLLAEEGINSTIAGSEIEVAAFFDWMNKDPRLADMERKTSECKERPFSRLKVRLKTEIVRMRAPEAQPHLGVGQYIDPRDWNKVIQDPGTTVVDVRNRYETEVGTFEGAIDPETDEFSEFPAYAAQALTDKDKPVALFCTGGIRCEKATAYLIQHGYTNVMHLKGGILNYLAQVPQEESLWRGTCFVFDDRRAVDHNLRDVREETV